LSAANEKVKVKLGNSHEFLENGKVGDSYTCYSFAFSLIFLWAWQQQL